MNTKSPLIAVAAASMIALAGCATSPGYGYGAAPAAAPAACYDCGTVTRIEAMTSAPPTGTAGAVIGGLVGAAAGREIAEDKSTGRRNTATAAGAAAGAVAGAVAQRTLGDRTMYNVTVRMNDGRVVVLRQDELGGVREGSYVRVYNGRAMIAR